jgi:hypothetical protein
MYFYYSPRFQPWAIGIVNILISLILKKSPSTPTPTQAQAQPESAKHGSEADPKGRGNAAQLIKK